MLNSIHPKELLPSLSKPLSQPLSREWCECDKGCDKETTKVATKILHVLILDAASSLAKPGGPSRLKHIVPGSELSQEM